MRLWTDTGLNGKEGAGGLLLETGSGLSFLPLPASILEQVAAPTSDPGVTSLKLPESPHQKPSSDQSVRETDVEVCFVCKKCRLAFPGESPLLVHQRQCYSGNQEGRGAFRIVQTGYECKSCNDRFKNILELRRHCESETHLKNAKLPLPPPAESPLSHEMEDVVNQITLLAARAAQEAAPDRGCLDSNSNTFAERKGRFLPPPDVAQPLTSAGH